MLDYSNRINEIFTNLTRCVVDFHAEVKLYLKID